MKSVLISNRPKWCGKICHKIGKDENGKPIYEKRIEVRKTAPKEVPFKAYIYCTYGNDRENYMLGSQGKIIGEFICDKVYKIEPIFSFYDCYSGYDDSSDFSYFEDYSIDSERLKKTCLTRQELYIYGKEKNLYGWHISDLKIYDKQKKLNEFFKPCPTKEKGDCLSCDCLADNDYGGVCTNNLTRPPQSWMYVEEIVLPKTCAMLSSK